MLVDCGEGTQMQMRRYGIPFSRVTDIFISHLHGDHCLGVPGLISTLALQGQSAPVNLHIPAVGTELFRRMLDFFCPGSDERVRLVPISKGGGIIAATRNLEVEAFPLYHRIPAFGFIFREKPRERRLLGDVADFLGIPASLRKGIKAGADWRRPSDGRVFDNAELTADPPEPLSYSYCSDTMADSRVAEACRGVDVMYHETTYLDDMASLAASRGHSTAAEAGRIAREAGAGTLVIGHYSKRYSDAAPLRSEAASTFGGPVIAADEGLCIDIAKPHG